jgi:phosphatidate cytidylyltransferase
VIPEGAPADDSGPMEPVPALPESAPAVQETRRRYGRAGRDLTAAVVVGVGLVALILASLLVVKAGFVVLVAAAVALAVWELSAALDTAGTRTPVVAVVLGAVAILAAAYAGGAEAMAVALSLTLAFLLAWRLPTGPAGFARDATSATLATLYVPFLAGFAVLMVRADDGVERIVTFVAVTVASDVGGYAAGVFLGRHPMAPTVSPKKSWEGFAGSVLLCTLAGALCVRLLLDGAALAGVLVGAAAALSATLGDLGESMIKRDLGLKDMGKLLPGHGGLMDRLDSLLPTAPVVWLMLSWLVPTR